MMRKKGSEAAKYMNDLSKSGKSGFKGWCLKTCRTAWDLGSDEESAIKEWDSIPEKHRHSDWASAPIGAPHFWKVGKFGHVAIQSAAKGWVWSTDAPEDDKVGLVGIPWFARHWGAVYLGWSSQFQNKVLPLTEPTVPKAAKESK